MVMFFASLDLGSCCGRAKPFNVDWRVIGYYWCFDSFISLFLFYFSSFQIISLLIWDGNAMIPRRKGGGTGWCDGGGMTKWGSGERRPCLVLLPLWSSFDNLMFELIRILSWFMSNWVRFDLIGCFTESHHVSRRFRREHIKGKADIWTRHLSI